MLRLLLALLHGGCHGSVLSLLSVVSLRSIFVSLRGSVDPLESYGIRD